LLRALLHHEKVLVGCTRHTARTVQSIGPHERAKPVLPHSAYAPTACAESQSSPTTSIFLRFVRSDGKERKRWGGGSSAHPSGTTA
jgi:hypothetical protein